MSFLSKPFLFIGVLLVGCQPASAPPVKTETCVEPPRGPFPAALIAAPAPATAAGLPNGRVVNIAPAPRHRWDSKSGLVESRDGTLLLHGVVAEDAPGELQVNVFADYQPIEVSVRRWKADRSARLDRPERVVAFDIELQTVVAIGSWREIETVVRLGDGALDVRRWTLYAGPQPPAGVSNCVRPEDVMSRGPRSSRDGDVVQLQSTQAIQLATWPRGGAITFIDLAPRTAVKLHAPAEVVVWPDPLSGPGPSWISTFWSVPAKQ